MNKVPLKTKTGTLFKITIFYMCQDIFKTKPGLVFTIIYQFYQLLKLNHDSKTFERCQKCFHKSKAHNETDHGDETFTPLVCI